MEILSITLLVLYSLMILVLDFKWNQIQAHQPSNKVSNAHYISVIIPARNEELSLPSTLESIINNNFPKDRYEIIVVDDHSEDRTYRLVENGEFDHPNISVRQLKGEKSGKKAAITFGIDSAQGDIILLTDADCTVPSNWIKSYYNKYSSESDVKMLFGPVQYKTHNFLTQILDIELSGLVGIGAATLASGHATMCNGANLSYRKSIFHEVNGYDGNEKIATGDDEFLLRKVHQQYPGGVAFLSSPDVMVTTLPPRTIFELYFQRKRWASKWKFHHDVASKLVPLYVMILNSMIIWFYWLLITGKATIFISGAFLIKLISDFKFIRNIATSMGKKFRFLQFIALQIIYPFYVVFFAIASNFGIYQWKDRMYSTNKK